MYSRILMNLGNIMLRERSQAQGTTCSMVPLVRNVPHRQVPRDSKSAGVARGWSG